ncbi:MAG: bifunctional pyr operon transcriptional regulator/uracil phosphoribosyltransferase PyrR [Gammaproteobacteria bacterium]|nr:bifunctional pyr operon transcriptional regulator/uracil phosphoribosyltransferase PyrR [Gammaproteobacteria bacterium]
MSDQLSSRLERHPLMVGIHTGGVWVAERLHKKLGLKEALGTLDISFYRDDFTRVGMNPQVRTSQLPVNVENRHLILVDDVLHTGRTIRAALNEIFDYGRPASVMLACLIERGGRELPIEPQVVGERISLGKNQHVKLLGPDKLELRIQEANG